MANLENAILELKEHQKEAYENMNNDLSCRGVAALVAPPGTGKTFVVLKYMQDNPDKKILFLSPRVAIREQVYEYIARYLGGITDSINKIQDEFGTIEECAKSLYPNIKGMLYQTILGIEKHEIIEDIIKKLRPDIIVIDEMHHVKTKNTDESEETKNNIKEENKWGEKFLKVVEIINKERALYGEAPVKIIGLSATPLRYDNVDVVDRLFDGRVSYELSLLEAIEAGILLPPKYVTTDYIKDDELNILQSKIDTLSGKQKEILEEKKRKLEQNLSKYTGITEIMTENIKKRDGKYIVFCKNIEDMENKMIKAQEWFGGIDENPEIYKISSKYNDSDNSRNIREFSNSDSEHLKLLYCVGMIGEGVHLEGVDGVILSSRVESRPTYIQRIGRGMSTSEEKQTVIIDLENNNEILFYDYKFNPRYEAREKGYELTDIEALEEAVKWIIEENEGIIPQEIKKTKERAIVNRLARIGNKYYIYATNPTLLGLIKSNFDRDTIEQIIALGEEIGLWKEKELIEDIDFPEKTDEFISSISVKGKRRELAELLEELSGMSNDERWEYRYQLFEKLITTDGEFCGLSIEEVKEVQDYYKEKGFINPDVKIEVEQNGEKKIDPIGKWLFNQRMRLMSKYDDFTDEQIEADKTIDEKEKSRIIRLRKLGVRSEDYDIRKWLEKYNLFKGLIEAEGEYHNLSIEQVKEAQKQFIEKGYINVNTVLIINKEGKEENINIGTWVFAARNKLMRKYIGISNAQIEADNKIDKKEKEKILLLRGIGISDKFDRMERLDENWNYNYRLLKGLLEADGEYYGLSAEQVNNIQDFFAERGFISEETVLEVQEGEAIQKERIGMWLSNNRAVLMRKKDEINNELITGNSTLSDREKERVRLLSGLGVSFEEYEEKKWKSNIRILEELLTASGEYGGLSAEEVKEIQKEVIEKGFCGKKWTLRLEEDEKQELKIGVWIETQRLKLLKKHTTMTDEEIASSDQIDSKNKEKILALRKLGISSEDGRAKKRGANWQRSFELFVGLLNAENDYCGIPKDKVKKMQEEFKQHGKISQKTKLKIEKDGEIIEDKIGVWVYMQRKFLTKYSSLTDEQVKQDSKLSEEYKERLLRLRSLGFKSQVQIEGNDIGKAGITATTSECDKAFEVLEELKSEKNKEVKVEE